jgi:hypothetical protein
MPSSFLKKERMHIKSQEYGSRNNDKRFADLRLKVGERQSPDRDDLSVPSEISLEDAWGELPRYQDKLAKERIKKE